MEKKTKKKNMVMTNEDIVKSYREAKDRRAQIKVLAELNVCPQELIIEILKEGGVDWRELPRVRKKAEKVATDEARTVETPVPTNEEGEAKVVAVEPAEGIVAEALAWYRSDLVRTVNKLRDEYDAIMADYAAKISEIDMKLAGVKDA